MPAHERYFGAVLFDQLEYAVGIDGPSIARWNGLVSCGTDHARVFLRI